MSLKNILFLLFFAGLAQSLPGQNHYRINGKSIPELRREREQREVFLPDYSSIFLFPLATPAATFPSVASALLDAPGRMPSAYSYQMLGIFCKFEVQLERAANFPIKFRLGEVQYTEGLEGKDRWSTPGNPQNR